MKIIFLQQVAETPIKLNLQMAQWLAWTIVGFAIVAGYTYLVRKAKLGLASAYAFTWTITTILVIYTVEFFTLFPRESPLTLEELFFFSVVPGFVAAFGCEISRRTATVGVDHTEALVSGFVALAVKVLMVFLMKNVATSDFRSIFVWNEQKTWKLEVWAVPVILIIGYLIAHPAHRWYMSRGVGGHDPEGMEHGSGGSSGKRILTGLAVVALIAGILFYNGAFDSFKAPSGLGFPTQAQQTTTPVPPPQGWNQGFEFAGRSDWWVSPNPTGLSLEQLNQIDTQTKELKNGNWVCNQTPSPLPKINRWVCRARSTNSLLQTAYRQ